MRILIATGSTGGHVFPAMALMDSIRSKHPQTAMLLVVPRTPLSERLVAGVGQVRFIRHNRISELRLANPRGVLNLARSWLESFKIILQFKPDVAVGFGTFDGLSVMVLAWLARAKTLIHEQNIAPGRANAFLSKLVDKVAISFAETQEALAVNPKRVCVTGNPLRNHLRPMPRPDALRFFGFDQNTQTILVVGGSQGSSSINTAVAEAICGLDNRGVQVIHITGEADKENVAQMYQSRGVRSRVFSFLPQMREAYCASDFAVCRSGAMTTSELIRFALPAVLVPYPFAGGHQTANAQFLEKNGCAVIIKEEQLCAQLMRRTIIDFLSDTSRIARLRRGYIHIPKPDEGDALADAVVTLAHPYS